MALNCVSKWSLKSLPQTERIERASKSTVSLLPGGHYAVFRTAEGIVFVDIEQQSAVQFPARCDSAIAHPLRSVVGLRLGDCFQVFDMNLKLRVGSANIPDVVFWTWLSNDSVGLVQRSSVSLWSPEQSQEVESVFAFDQTVFEGKQIVQCCCNEAQKWWFVGALGHDSTAQPPISGVGLIYHGDRDVNQLLPFYYCLFCNETDRGGPLIFFAGMQQLAVIMLPDNCVKNKIELRSTLEEGDLVVGMHFFRSSLKLAAVTKRGTCAIVCPFTGVVLNCVTLMSNTCFEAVGARGGRELLCLDVTMNFCSFSFDSSSEEHQGGENNKISCTIDKVRELTEKNQFDAALDLCGRSEMDLNTAEVRDIFFNSSNSEAPLHFFKALMKRSRVLNENDSLEFLKYSFERRSTVLPVLRALEIGLLTVSSDFVRYMENVVNQPELTLLAKCYFVFTNVASGFAQMPQLVLEMVDEGKQEMLLNCATKLGMASRVAIVLLDHPDEEILFTVMSKIPHAELHAVFEECGKRHMVPKLTRFVNRMSGLTDPTLASTYVKLLCEERNGLEIERFVCGHQKYLNCAIVGDLCEAFDDDLALRIYEFGNVGNKVMELYIKRAMFEELAKFLLQNKSIELWKKALGDTLITDAVFSCVLRMVTSIDDPDVLSVLLKALLEEDRLNELLLVLDKVLFSSDSSLKSNQFLQNLALFTAIKLRRGDKLAEYLNNLKDYDFEGIARAAEERGFYEDAISIFSKHGMHKDAVLIMVNKLDDKPRARWYAQEIGDRDLFESIEKK